MDNVICIQGPGPLNILHTASFCVQFQSFDQVEISSQTMRLSIYDELSGVKLTSRGHFLFHLKLTSHQFWEIVWIA